MSDFDPPEVTGYRLILKIAGPGYEETVSIKADDILELTPLFVEVNGLMFERYGKNDDYVEWRFDYVVHRSLSPILEDPEPAAQVAGLTVAELELLEAAGLREPRPEIP